MATVALPTDLLERAEQLETLAEAYAAVAATSQGRLALVHGEAGIGKTALVRRFCDEQAGSARILWGACEALFTPRPLGPILDIAAGDGAGLVADLHPEDAQPYEIAAALTGELRANAPTILVVEDLHWADEATLDVVRIIVRRIDTVPALVVATYRDDQLDLAHPLRIVLGELGTSGSVTRLDVGPLSPEAVADLAAPHGLDAGELYLRTGGNPFFVTEVLASGEEHIPATVRDAVLARAARLSPGARTVLEAVAIAPPQVELWLLDALADDPAAHLEECLGSGMLVAGATSVAFRHELARLAASRRGPAAHPRTLRPRAGAGAPARSRPPRPARRGPRADPYVGRPAARRTGRRRTGGGSLAGGRRGRSRGRDRVVPRLRDRQRGVVGGRRARVLAMAGRHP